MNSTSRILASLAFSTLIPATAMTQTSIDYDRAQDFAQLRTYSFKDCTKSDNPFVDERIAAAVAGQLAARGMTRDDAHPDVYVTTRQAFDTQREYSATSLGYFDYPYGGWGWGSGWGWGDGYGYRWGYNGWGPGYTNVVTRDIVVGTLTVDLRDSENDRLVWRGVEPRIVKPESKPSHVDRSVNHQVKEIFEHYPPK